jgi:hypothetical protein
MNNHPLDFFVSSTPLRDEQTGGFPRPAPAAIEAVTRAYRAGLEAYVDRTFTPVPVKTVRALHGFPGGANRAMVEAALDGRTEIAGFVSTGGNGEVDGDGNPKITVSLRVRSPKQQADGDYSVERAFDALRTAVSRFDRAYPQLAAAKRQEFLADDRAEYNNLLRLVVTPTARRAAAGILGALGRTERKWIKATAFTCEKGGLT